jgi:hypothetical protein
VIPEQIDTTEQNLESKIQTVIASHPLLAESGLATDVQEIAQTDVFKAFSRWLPYITAAFFILRYFRQQQNVFLLRRIEKQLQRLEKKA